MIKKLLLIFIGLLVCFEGQAQTFKKTGYIPDYRWNDIGNMDLSKLTHVFVAFVNPDTAGTITFSQNINGLVNIAHNQGCKVIPSFAGGGSYSWGADTAIYKKLIDQNQRSNFIHKMMDYVRLHNLDGIDLDLEGYALQLSDFNLFAQETADSVHAAGLEISAALALGWNNSYALAISDLTLQKMDFITTMSYGGVGSWNYNQPSDQFPYSGFTDDIDYWVSRGMNPHQVVGGLAFYGVEFPMSPQNTYWQFNLDLCSIYTNPSYASQDPLHNDMVTTSNQHPVYYNGLPTFKKKIKYAADNAGGYMIWELGGDCFSGNVNILDSLNTYVSEALEINAVNNNTTISVYPNPSNSEITIVSTNDLPLQWTIYNGLGEKVVEGKNKHFSIANLSSGFYSIRISQNEKNTTTVLIKN